MSTLLNSNDLFDHLPERLVIYSCRSAMAGYEHGDPSCWDQLWRDLCNDCGLERACNLAGPLQHFVQALRACSEAGLTFYPRACRWVCRHECLALSLLAGSQHGDAAACSYCLDALAQGGQVKELALAAQLLARRLLADGLALMPVPLSVIAAIAEQTCRRCPVARTCGH